MCKTRLSTMLDGGGWRGFFERCAAETCITTLYSLHKHTPSYVKQRGRPGKARVEPPRRHPFQLAAGYEKNTTFRYIAGPPAAHRGPRPSQPIKADEPSASDATAAPVPVV